MESDCWEHCLSTSYGGDRIPRPTNVNVDIVRRHCICYNNVNRENIRYFTPQGTLVQPLQAVKFKGGYVTPNFPSSSMNRNKSNAELFTYTASKAPQAPTHA